MRLAVFDVDREIGNAEPVRDFDDFRVVLAGMVFFVDPALLAVASRSHDEDVQGRVGEVGLEGAGLNPWAGLAGA